MAWQSSGPMAGGGGMAGAGGDGGANGGGHPQGTEYTLQGVMRFLQTEWHRHERDRNAWEIERAEMKSRIGGLEGDARTSKRMQESLGKHVKILESALKREREKVKILNKGEKVDTSKDPKEAAKENLKIISKYSLNPLNTSLDREGENEDPNQPDFRQDNERDKSRMYLGKCSQEITYHVIPAAHPPPSLDDPPELTNHVYPNQQMPQQSLEEAYVQQRQKQQQNNIPMVREPVVQNHQPMLSTNFENQAMSRSNNQHHPLSTSRGMERHNYDQHPPPLTAIDGRKPFELPSSSDEQVESISHSYDSHGKIISGKREVESIQTTEIPIPKEESEGWNFDDSPSALEAPSDEPRRDSDNFPGTIPKAPMSPPRLSPGSHRRKSSGARRRSEGGTSSQEMTRSGSQQAEPSFKVRFALRGHLDVVRTVIFTGGGSPSEPEICTSGDDGTLKRWIIPASYGSFGPHGMPQGPDLDITAYFTHRGHNGSVTSLAACPASQNFSNGGRALGDGWVFSGGQDASVRVWERGRVDPKAILDGHTDAVWALAILPGSSASILGERCGHYGGPDRILLASGGADGRILIWAVSAPPQLNSPHTGSRRGAGRRANSVSSGSNFPSSPQPSTATATPFHYTLVHHIVRADHPSPTCISPLSGIGDTFVVSYTDASILIYDTRSGEEVVGMASLETYDGTPSTGVNSVVASTMGFDATHHLDPGRGLTEDDSVVHGATGSSGGVEGVIISGYEDRYIRFFDANSGQCTYTMLAHPSAISSLSLSPDGRELVSAGHDASLRFWSLEKRSCTQEITSHRLMRGEGVCAVVWSQDGRWVVSAGGDGVVKVFAR